MLLWKKCSTVKTHTIYIHLKPLDRNFYQLKQKLNLYNSCNLTQM